MINNKRFITGEVKIFLEFTKNFEPAPCLGNSDLTKCISERWAIVYKLYELGWEKFKKVINKG